MDRAGIAGEDGPTHHGALDIAYLKCVQDLIVTAPKDGNELRHLLYTALDYTDGPFSIRYPKASSVNFDTKGQAELLPIGSWEVCRKSDGNTVILAVGPPKFLGGSCFTAHSNCIDSILLLKPCTKHTCFQPGPLLNVYFAPPVNLPLCCFILLSIFVVIPQ